MTTVSASDFLPPELKHVPQRVVSLVPSLTESLFELGYGASVVGVSDYCTRPAQAVTALPHVGGTKNPDVAAILSLQPDLVLANWEENTRQAVEALRAAGVQVWVSHPQTVDQALQVLRDLKRLYRSREAHLRIHVLERAVEWARRAAISGQPVRYFCPIWFDDGAGEPWWMSFNRQTYCHDLLSLFGGENVFANRQRRYPLAADLGQALPEDPGQRDTRYPRLSLEEVRAAQPDLILLPDEPFPFEAQHHQILTELLPNVPAVQTNRIHLVDGSLITWHGTRLGLALRELPALFAWLPGKKSPLHH